MQQRLLTLRRFAHSWPLPSVALSPKALTRHSKSDALVQVQRFNGSIGVTSADMPPSSWYMDKTILQAELGSVFANNWQYVARADQVKERGSFVSTFIGLEPVVIVRGKDNILRSFSNVCRHHAARITEGCGVVEKLVCPYHGWEYNLEGRLTKATRLKGIECFTASKVSLPSLAVEEWGPFVFVKLNNNNNNSHNSSHNSSSVAKLLEPLKSGAQRNVDWNSYHFFKRRIYEIQCNWKYHIEYLHLGLSSELDMGGYDTVLANELLSIQTCHGRNTRIGGVAHYNFLYPNLAVNVYGNFIDTNLVLPIAPERCVIVFDWYHKQQDYVCTDDALQRSQAIQDEDVSISESVQSGIASMGYESGRYAAPEMAEYHFHRQLQKDLISYLSSSS